MPLYKKTTSKARVQTQSSFISPLLSQTSTTQTKIKDLLKDDYMENLRIPTKNKFLEPLINISKGGDLLDQLQQKSFKNSSKSLVEVSKTKETYCPRKVMDGVNKETAPTFTNLVSEIECDNAFDKDGNVRKKSKKHSLKGARSKSGSNRTLSELHTQSPLLFSESENDLDDSLRSILDDIVNTNIILSQNMKDNDESNQTENKTEATKSKKKKDKQALKPNIQKTKTTSREKNVTSKTTGSTKPMSTEENESGTILRRLLDDVVKANIVLSQEMMTEDHSSKNLGNKPKKNRHNNKKIEKHKDTLKHKVKKTTDLKNDSKKSKENIGPLSKSKEIINSTLDHQSEEIIKIKSFKRIRAICSEEDTDDQMAQPIVSHKENNKPIIMKNTAADKLKEKIKNKYLIEKKTCVKPKGKNSQNSKNFGKGQTQGNQEKKENILKAKGGKQSGVKNLAGSKSSITDNQRKGTQVATKAIKCPRKPKNMIFTSEKMDLKRAFELQEERDVGLYVYCDMCDKVRYLEQCKDPLEMPEKWYCHMNPDTNYNRCSDPDFDIELEKEDLIIFNKFNAGSIVWAKMDGFPWWPAMVDDDPDVTDYFWLDDENSKEPSWYHVTFFDSSDVTRAWIRTANLEPFKVNEKNAMFKPKKYEFYRNRLAAATKEAKAACNMGILQRLRLYSFVVRYSKKRTNHTKKKCPKKTDVVKKTQNLVDNTDGGVGETEQMPREQAINNDAGLEENMDFDNLSLASSEFISNILKSKKPGKKIVSEDDILENIELNHLISSEDPFDMV